MGAAPSIRLPSAVLHEHVEALLKLPRLPELVSESIARESCGPCYDPVVWASLPRDGAGLVRRADFVCALLDHRESRPPEAVARAVLDGDVSARGIARRIRDIEASGEPGVVVMCGAGISVSAGIPDFRTPGTGLYDNLQKYSLPRPEAVFELAYFKERPEAFCALARELAPGNFRPTATHYFLALLERKRVLRRVFTQNIDALERAAGVPPERVVEAHGSFASCRCIACQREHSTAWFKAALDAAPRAVARCDACGGLVKPDIVFYGEMLPDRFRERRRADLPRAQLLLVMGTSLRVGPFNTLIDDVGPGCPRLLVNREPVAARVDARATEVGDGRVVYRQGDFARGFALGRADNYRDAAMLCDCDDAVWTLCDELGWRDDLVELMALGGDAPAAGDAEGLADAGARLARDWRTPDGAAADDERAAPRPAPRALPKPVPVAADTTTLRETVLLYQAEVAGKRAVVEQQVRELKETVLATQATIAKAQATVSKTIDGAQAVLAPEDSVK